MCGHSNKTSFTIRPNVSCSTYIFNLNFINILYIIHCYQIPFTWLQFRLFRLLSYIHYSLLDARQQISLQPTKYICMYLVVIHMYVVPSKKTNRRRWINLITSILYLLPKYVAPAVILTILYFALLLFKMFILNSILQMHVSLY